MATSLTFGPALTQFAAAPRPRPPRLLPQPIRPTRITSLPAACTLATEAKLVAKAAPATAVAEVLRKSRREEFGAPFCGIWFAKVVCLLRNSRMVKLDSTKDQRDTQ